ncbi:MAG: type VI secretion system-associated FHA domain protein TagH [Gammaproteobacteria bacterium]|nr:type VI secretion system-associated FHA domain protein TagH [Gammaproteobacteria bacterium]
MDLLLEIISHQRHVLTDTQSKFIFKAAGGTIGRNENNDWSINDPERLISGHHASIQFEKNQFIIIDNSSNGLFINHDEYPLGEQLHTIVNGDIFLLGQYSIQATLIATQSKAVFSNSYHNHPGDSGNLHSSLSHSSHYSDEPSIPLFPQDLPHNTSQYIDPLSQFNDDISPGRKQEGDILFEPDPVNSVLDPIPSTQSFFDLPNAIPENWLKDDFQHGSDESQKNASFTKQTESLPVKDKQENRTIQNEIIVGDFDDFKKDFSTAEMSDIGLSPQPVESPQSVKSPQPVESHQPVKSPQQKNSPEQDGSHKLNNSHQNNIDPQTNRKFVDINLNSQQEKFEYNEQVNVAKATISSKSSISDHIYKDSMNTLLMNLGINPDDVTPEQLPELAANISHITKNSMSGIMKTMMSRAHLKNEFRMSMTTIKTQENNPLKFCINYEQLLHYMLLEPMNGYLDSKQAIKESFNELQEHQVGVMAGMKSALNHILNKLSPEKIIEKSDKIRSKTLTLSSKKSRYWDAFNDLYNDIKDEDDAFNSLFGNEFCKAYERQIDDIRQARK